jgi:two-component system chemotaxis response regulator CheB
LNRIVVTGASAGGIDALKTIVSALPGDFAAPVLVVLHTAPTAPGILDQILARAGRLPAMNAVTGQRIEPGHIYVAPPDHHLIVEPGLVRITRGPRENRFRPAIDPTFRSAAQVYGPGVIGVILTGYLDDGAAGMAAIAQLGGTTIVQDPADALFPDMPSNVLKVVQVDHRVALSEIAPLLVRLVNAPLSHEGAVTVPDDVGIEVQIAAGMNAMEAGVETLGTPSCYACPECHGVLLQLKQASPMRFRCHTGHAYSVESLMAAIREGVGDAVWTAIRSLEESVLLMRQLADHVKQHGDDAAADRLVREADEAHRRSEVIRRLENAD